MPFLFFFVPFFIVPGIIVYLIYEDFFTPHMAKNVINIWQESVIAIGLFLVIPAAVFLGCKLISPTIDYRVYHDQRYEFFKGYLQVDKETLAQREKEWEQIDFFIEFQNKERKVNFVKLLVAGPLSVVLFYLGSVFVLPIIGASLLATGLSLVWFLSWGYYNHFLSYGIRFILIEMIIYFLSLLIVLWYAYQRSEKI